MATENNYAEEAADSAKDASINMEDVSYFLETDNTTRAIKQIEWAIDNSKIALRKMKLALVELKTE